MSGANEPDAERKKPGLTGPNAKNQNNYPVALTIAGSDSSAGAGIQADLKTFSALGVYGLTAVTCVVAETPGKVSRIEAISSDGVGAQIDLLLEAFPIGAIKTGLLYSAEIITRVADSLTRPENDRIPLVVDPVMIATSGDRLLQPAAIALYETKLFPRATLITPNLDEAAVLLGREIKDESAMRDAAEELARKFGTSILLKGGHLRSAEAVDLLCENESVTRFSAPSISGVATHGTGCTYSAAITAGLARGLGLKTSIKSAKGFVTGCIQNHFRWDSICALNHSASPRCLEQS